jgi:hypothetical protein
MCLGIRLARARYDAAVSRFPGALNNEVAPLHSSSNEWSMRAKFKSAPAGSIAELKFKLRNEHYPFWSRGRLDKVTQIEMLASQPLQMRYRPSASSQVKATLVADPSLRKILRARLPNESSELAEKPTGESKVFLNHNSIKDLFLAVAWQKATPSLRRSVAEGTFSYASSRPNGCDYAVLFNGDDGLIGPIREKIHFEHQQYD